MQLIQEKRIPYFQFDAFFGRRIRHGVFTRRGGVSPRPFEALNLSSAVGDDPACYRENRRRAYGTFGRTFDTLVHAHLVHRADVAVVTRADHGRVMAQVDGLITNAPGCGLTMNYADCAPILLYDPVNHAIGLGHAGWGGTVHDVPGALVRAMQAAFGSHPHHLIGAIGPCISAAVYEVGADVITAVQSAFPAAAGRLLIPPPASPTGRPHFDLPAANRINFERAGVAQIETSGLCTGQNTDWFFSHRAEKGRTGRFGVVFILA